MTNQPIVQFIRPCLFTIPLLALSACGFTLSWGDTCPDSAIQTCLVIDPQAVPGTSGGGPKK